MRNISPAYKTLRTGMDECIGGADVIEFKTMRYKVILHRSSEGYDVSCPGLPGCWSQGKTEEEAMNNIRLAITEYLAAVNETLKGADVREIDVPA
jgi:predicted RNase H-like HicB family nuclease